MSKFNIIKLFIASTLTLASAVPALATQGNISVVERENNFTYHSTDKILINQATYKVCTRDKDGKLNMRNGPGGRYSVVLQIPNGARISVVDWSKDISGYTWYKIYFRNYEGWVRNDFLCS